MNSLTQKIDKFLNKFTMYKTVSFSLIALLVISIILAFTGVISISGTGLLITIAVAAISCYFFNFIFATAFNAQRNYESWLITAWILACILPQATTVTRALYIALAGAIAMASKYVLVYRQSHIFNPAATAALVLSVTGLLPATWWIATPALAPVTIIIALIVLRKQRKFTLFLTFAAAAVLMSIYVGVGLHDQAVGTVLRNGLLSLPLIFMGSIMLTEPITLAPRRYYQVLIAAVVGVFYASQLQAGNFSTTPEAALILAGLLTVLIVPTYGATLRLKALTKLSPSLYDLAFEKPTKGLQFTAGQYMEWTLGHKGTDLRGNRRTFSIASSPSEELIHIGTKQYEPSSTFKNAFLAMKPGQTIRVAHVAGDFTLPNDSSQPLLFIAGGIGITPFRSMLQHLVDMQQKRDVVLLYSANTKEDFIYADTFRAASDIGLETHLITTRLSSDDLKKLVPDITKRVVYLSGPDAMVNGYKAMVRASGVATNRIKADHFSGY